MVEHMTLSAGTLLQGGKYRIEKDLGQGGFGVTYRAKQTALKKVVTVKEFFMKDCCERGEDGVTMTVGISKGYAPLEQSKAGDVAQFSPATDIYALGATLYFLVTGNNPPEAADVNEDGIERPNGLSDRIWTVIERAMQPRRKDRPQSVGEFLALLEGRQEKVTHVDEETTVIEDVGKEDTVVGDDTVPSEKKALKPKDLFSKKMLVYLLSAIALISIIYVFLFRGKASGSEDPDPAPSTRVGYVRLAQLTDGLDIISDFESKYEERALDLEKRTTQLNIDIKSFQESLDKGLILASVADERSNDLKPVEISLKR